MSHVLLILIAIRDSGTRSLVRTALTGEGHKVIESSDYRQARLLLSNGLDPDLVLVESGVSDAAETAERFRLLECAPKHKMCFILGMGDQQLREELSDAGIVHFLMKPTTRGDIESMIDKLSHVPVHRAAGKSISHLPDSISLKPQLSQKQDRPLGRHRSSWKNLGTTVFSWQPRPTCWRFIVRLAFLPMLTCQC